MDLKRTAAGAGDAGQTGCRFPFTKRKSHLSKDGAMIHGSIIVKKKLLMSATFVPRCRHCVTKLLEFAEYIVTYFKR